MQTAHRLGATHYSKSINTRVMQYADSASQAGQSSEYLAVLKQNTKRVQGSLVVFGYELEGGADTSMILQAALALELFHAYTQCLEQGIAVDQALRAAHEAEIILANLEAAPENRLKAISITNRTMMLATLARNLEAKKEDALHWRATEIALNPVHVGQVLAGADCTRTNAVTDAALTLGKSLLRNETSGFEVFLNSKF